MQLKVFKKAELRLKQVQQRVCHHVWGDAIGKAEEETPYITEVKRNKIEKQIEYFPWMEGIFKER